MKFIIEIFMITVAVSAAVLLSNFIIALVGIFFVLILPVTVVYGLYSLIVWIFSNKHDWRK